MTVSPTATPAAVTGRKSTRQRRPHSDRRLMHRRVHRNVAVGETVILLRPPLPLAGVPTWMERGCQRNDSLADGAITVQLLLLLLAWAALRRSSF